MREPFLIYSKKLIKQVFDNIIILPIIDIMSIHLIFETEELDVDKNILLQFEYFRNLLDMQPDNIKITNVNIILFKILVHMIQNNDVIKDIAILSDFLGHDSECKPLADCKCAIEQCNKIALNTNYCEQHTCIVKDCENGIDSNKYCFFHKCKICKNIKYDNFDYCLMHKCIINDCHYSKELGLDMCISHKCYKDKCSNQRMQPFAYCVTHKCRIKDCGSLNNNHDYCYEHVCIKTACSNKRLSNAYFYCKNHMCMIHGCEYPCGNICQLCDFHRCSYKDCTKMKVYTNLFCENHTKESNS